MQKWAVWVLGWAVSSWLCWCEQKWADEFWGEQWAVGFVGVSRMSSYGKWAVWAEWAVGYVGMVRNEQWWKMSSLSYGVKQLSMLVVRSQVCKCGRNEGRMITFFLNLYTTSQPWSRYPPDQSFVLDRSWGSFSDIFTISTFLPEHSFMVKS